MANITLTKNDAIARITLSRPEKRNAMGPSFWKEMPAIVAEVDADVSIRAAILDAQGPSFCAGLDLVAMMGELPLEPGKGPDGARQARFHQLIRDCQRAVTCIERSRVPIIAAIDGHCLGGGVDLICACDIRLSSPSASYSVKETKLALVPDLGTLQRLPVLVGQGIARELIFTGRTFDAAYAQEIGLVNRIADDVAAEAEGLAREIAANAPLAVQGSKRVLNEASNYEVDRGLEFVATWNAAHMINQDLGVAVAAFVSKQEPEFSGR